MRRVCVLTVLCFALPAAVAWGSTLVLRPEARIAASSAARQSPAHHSSMARKASRASSKSAPSRPNRPQIMFGDRAVDAGLAADTAGVAEAFPFRSKVSGVLSSINIYLASGSHAARLLAAVYSAGSRKPGERIAAGVLAGPKARTWNEIPVLRASVKSGTMYWLVLMGNGGTLFFRHPRRARCAPSPLFRRGMSSLPRVWTGGSPSRVCGISAYVRGTSRTVIHGPIITNTSGTSKSGAPTDVSAPTTGTDATATTTTTTTTQLLPVLPPIDLTSPAISGTAKQGQALSSSTGTWLNSPTSYSYQWEDCDSSGNNCAGINGATANTYTLQGSDVGDTLRAVVTASNSGGSGSATSAASAIVASSGTGGTFLVGDQAVAPDADSNVAGTAQAFSYTATASGTTSAIDVYIDSATTATRLIVGIYSDNGGKPGSLLASGSTTTLQAAAWNQVSVGSVSLASGSAYWIALLGTGGQTNYQDTSAGSAASYVESQTGLTSLPATYSSGTEYNVSPASAYVVGVAANPPAAPVNGGAPVVSGQAVQGQSLSTSNGSWSNSPTSYAYQWQDCNGSGGGCANIGGATASSYTLQSSDVGDTVRAVVTASNAGGSGSADSAVTGTVSGSAPAAPVNGGAPVVSGQAVQGQSLSTSNGSWSNSPTSYAYQWQDCNGSGGGCANIGGATASSYTLQSSDVGDTVRAVVTASNAGGSGSADSAVTGVVTASSGSDPQIYLAQSAAGSGSGADCNDAKAVSFFNSGSNWGSGSGKIGPGVTVDLCGTISTPLVAQGSGSSGNPVTVYWEPNASLSEAVCPSSGCFDTNGQKYLTLNGGSSGSIQSTANGTGRANQVSGVEGILATSCTGCTIEDLTIDDMYVHTSTSDSTIDGSQNRGIDFSGSNLTIKDNTLHDDAWSLYGEFSNGDANVTLAGNNIYNSDHTIALTSGTDGGSTGPVFVYGNHLHDWGGWDTNNDSYHHDGIHCYTVANGPAHWSGIYIYDNRFDGSTGADITSEIFLEGGSGSGYTPCADSTSPIYVFNNIFTGNTPVSNGYLGLFSGSPRVYNNTLIGDSSSDSSICSDLNGGTNYEPSSMAFENNLTTTCNNEIGAQGGTFASGQPDYNLWANGGDNSFVCSGNFYTFSQFTNWRSCIGNETHSAATSNALLNSDGSLQSGSPASGFGANLTSLCTGNLTPLCSSYTGPPASGGAGSTTNGTTRPTTGAWDAGAY